MKIKNKLKFNYQEIIFLLYILYFTVMYDIPQLYSLLNNFSIIFNLGVSCMFFILNIKNISVKRRFLVALIILNLVIGTLINNTGFGSIITMINLYLLFLYGDNNKIREKCIIISCFIVSIGEIFLMFANKTYYNPNTIGYLYFIKTVFISILIITKTQNKKSKYIKILHLVILAINVINIYNSGARASLLGTITFLVLMLLPFLMKSKKLFKIMTFIIIIGAVIFPYIYVSMWRNGIEVNLEYSNKQFYSGRQVVWNNMLYEFEGNELYGIGSRYSLNPSLHLNAHNSLFAVFTIYGIINFVFFILLFIEYIWKMQKNSLNITNRIATAGIIGIIIVSYYETNLIEANSFMYFVSLSIIALKELKEDKRNEEFEKIEEINNSIYTNVQ